MRGETAASVRAHGLESLPVGSVAHVLPSALRMDEEGHVWISRSPAVIDSRPRFGRIEVHRKGPDDYRVSVPWSVTARWSATAGAASGDAIRAKEVTHYPLPWSRGVWWLTRRSRAARVVEDWMSQRNRVLSWVVTGAAWVAPFAMLAVGLPVAHMAIFWIVWGASNFPPIHSAIEALWTRNSQRFAQPGKYVRPWQAEELRRDNAHLRKTVPAPDLLPTALRYHSRATRPHKPPLEHVRNFFSTMMSEGSTVPQFSMTMGVTAFGFVTKHFTGRIVDPIDILLASWAASQVSTFHSIYEAVQMKRHGISWKESIARITNPTAFPSGRRFGSSVDYALYAAPPAPAAHDVPAVPAVPTPAPGPVTPPAAAPRDQRARMGPAVTPPLRPGAGELGL